jgi:hypothetical protein
MMCHSCSTNVDADWAFCGTCGAALLSATPAAPAPTSVMSEMFSPRIPSQAVAETRSERVESVAVEPLPAPLVQSVLPAGSRELKRTSSGGRRAMRIASAGALVALVAATALLGWTTHSRGADLASTRHQLASTKTRLASTSAALASSKNTVQSDEDEITSLDAQITKLNNQISNARTQLKGTRNTVDLQSQQISNLRTCLNGVSTALSDAASGFLDFAVSDLQGVSGACQAADNGLG